MARFFWLVYSNCLFCGSHLTVDTLLRRRQLSPESHSMPGPSFRLVFLRRPGGSAGAPCISVRPDGGSVARYSSGFAKVRRESPSFSRRVSLRTRRQRRPLLCGSTSQDHSHRRVREPARIPSTTGPRYCDLPALARPVPRVRRGVSMLQRTAHRPGGEPAAAWTGDPPSV